MPLVFDWDSAKAWLNQAKHGVTFADDKCSSSNPRRAQSL
jgi:uncharacterized DUF497 family protein